MKTTILYDLLCKYEETLRGRKLIIYLKINNKLITLCHGTAKTLLLLLEEELLLLDVCMVMSSCDSKNTDLVLIRG